MCTFWTANDRLAKFVYRTPHRSCTWPKAAPLYERPSLDNFDHSLSQQGVWVSFWTPKNLKKHPSGHPKHFMKNFLKCQSQAYNWIFYLHIIPMTMYKDIVPYFDKFIHVYGWNMSILLSPLKFWTPQNFTIANFRHPVSKSWLRPWFWYMASMW